MQLPESFDDLMRMYNEYHQNSISPDQQKLFELEHEEVTQNRHLRAFDAQARS